MSFRRLSQVAMVLTVAALMASATASAGKPSSYSPTLGVSWGPNPRFGKSFNLERGARPTQPTQVALDETTAKKAKVDVGDPVRIVFLSVPPQELLWNTTWFWLTDCVVTVRRESVPPWPERDV